MGSLIAQTPKSRDRIFPFIGGKELLNHPRQLHHRHAINFADCTLDEADQWPELLEIIRNKVKPQRDLLGGYSVAERRREYWWQYGTYTPALFRAVASLHNVLAISLVAPHLALAQLPAGMVYSHKLAVYPFEQLSPFAALQARIHEVWVRQFTSTLEDRLNYSPSDCFATFPFPRDFETDGALEAVGQAYNAHRAQLMIARDEGLTKVYNRFHEPNENSPDIVRLRELHDAMDRAVLSAYGWTDLAERIATDPESVPRHLTEDTEDDHKYQGRFFWPASIRDEVLARLLALNAERAEDERLAGLTPAASEDDSEVAGEGDESDDEAA